jgi:Delta6-protoilludene synthase
MVLSNLKFRPQTRALPSWGGKVDADIGTFVERLSYWIRRVDCWSLETERYFDMKLPVVQKHRLVTSLPKVKDVDVVPMMARPNTETLKYT